MTARRLTVLCLTLLLAATAPVVVGRAHADGESSSGGGKSIVEQIGCDETVVLKDGTVGVNRACQINDFVNLFVYLSKWGMSILAILATATFIYGGFSFITAGGRPSKVDEGKRVIAGTVIGTIISLTAYVIINTVVTSVSGFTLTSMNPIGVVFGDKTNPANTINGQTIYRPFSGTVQTGSGGSGTGAGVEACRAATSNWIRDCSADNLQVYCADPGPTGGEIMTLQTRLNNVLRCACGTPDGCYGRQTVDCVRHFQIANQIPPTGVIDAYTKDKIENGNTGCGDGQDVLVSAQLPATELQTGVGSDRKCCVVKNGTQDLYCVGGISTRACQALGGGSTAYEGNCGSGETASRCGYCSNTSQPSQTDETNRCMMSVSPSWCSTNNLSYFNNSCTGQCNTCTNAVLVLP